MASEIVHNHGRIVLNQSNTSGVALVKSAGIPVEQVLAKLASCLDIAELVRAYPDLTRDDVRAVLSYARDRVRAEAESAQPVDAVSPQQFYAEMTSRPDVSELLRR